MSQTTELTRGASEGPLAHPLMSAVQKALDALLRAAPTARASYAVNIPAHERPTIAKHAEAFRDLRQCDRLLAVLSSSSGAVDKAGGSLSVQPMSQIIWAFSLARLCLQTFLFRKLYDAGYTLGESIDPCAFENEGEVPRLESTLAALENGLVNQALDGFGELLEGISEQLSAGWGESASEIARDRFFARCAELAGYCGRVLENVQKKVSPLDSLVESSRRIDRLAADLKRLKDVVSDLCDQIVNDLKYELCAVQMIRSDDVIETTHGRGAAADWVNLARHRVTQEVKLRDIQADIVMRRRVEVIRGRDPRFDDFLHKTFKHDEFVRVFVPWVIFRKPDNSIVDPPEDCWVRDDDPVRPAGTLVLGLVVPEGLQVDVIGTVEAGIRANGEITESAAQELAVLVTRSGPRAYRHSLDYALEKAVEQVMRLADGDSASLHIMDHVETPQPCWIVHKGQMGRVIRAADKPPGGIGAPPRREGIGAAAIAAERRLVIPDRRQGDTLDDLRRANGQIVKQGVLTVLALPLSAGKHKAVAYVHYKREELPAEDRLVIADLLARRCGHMIESSLELADHRDRFQQALLLSKVMQDLTPGKYGSSQDLCWAIGWYTLNLLAADVVTVHEFRDGQFLPESPVAGRLMHDDMMGGEIRDDDVRWDFIRLESPLFFSSAEEQSYWTQRNRQRQTPSFVKREEIRSTAVGPLRSSTGSVGLVFINFRTPHDFSDLERMIIINLANECGEALRRFRKESDRVRLEPGTTPGAASAPASVRSTPGIGLQNLRAFVEGTPEPKKNQSNVVDFHRHARRGSQQGKL